MSEEIANPNMPSLEEIRWFRARILSWARNDNIREFPWRIENVSPYEVLISEILLKRTTAKQVKGVYPLFIRAFPNPDLLSKARLKEIEEMVCILGLKNRAALLIELGRTLVEKGCVPKEIADLRSLPGVGPYTASATRCFAWGFPEPLIDTNGVRILAKFFSIPSNASSHRDPYYINLMGAVLSKRKPVSFNRALLDLGGTKCTPRNPVCIKCPLRTRCHYTRDQIVG